MTDFTPETGLDYTSLGDPPTPDENIETVPTTSTIDAGALNAYNAFNHQGFSELARTAKIFETQELNPGRFLTSQQAKEEGFTRPGLTYPNGVNINVAKIKRNIFDADAEVQAELNNTNNSILASVSMKVGGFLGFVASPTNIISFGLGGKLIGGPVARAVAGRLAFLEPVASIAERAVTGGAIGGAGFIPAALAEHQQEKEMGENPTALSVFTNIYKGVGLGALIDTAGGFIAPILKTEHAQAMKAAYEQVAGGVKANIVNIIKNGFYQARNSEVPRDSDAMNDAISEANEGVEKLNEQLTKDKKALKDLETGDKPQKVDAPTPTATDLLSRAHEIRRIEPGDRTMEQHEFLNKMPDTDEIQDGLRFSDIPEEERTPEQAQHLDDLLNDKEAELINARKQAESKVSRKLKAKAKVADNDREKNDLLGKADAIRARTLKANKRLNSLKKNDKFKPSAKSVKLKRGIARNEIKKSELTNKINANQLGLQSTRENAPPVDTDSVRADRHILNSAEGDSVYNAQELKDFEDTQQGIPNELDSLLEETDNLIKETKQAGILTDEDEEQLKTIDKDKSRVRKLGNALLQVFSCLAGA